MSSTKVIRFTADWSEPCKEYLEIFLKTIKDYPDIEVQAIDIESEDGVEMANEYGVTGVPTTIIYKQDEFRVKVGVVPEQELRESLND